MDYGKRYNRLDEHIENVKKRMEEDEVRFNKLKESRELTNNKISELLKHKPVFNRKSVY